MLWLTLVLALVAQGTPQADVPPMFVVFNWFQGDGYDFEVTEQQLTSSPPWLATADNPPLSARAAIQAARPVVLQLTPGDDRWRITEVNVRHVHDQWWVYVVGFAPPPPPIGGPMNSAVSVYDTLRVVVLMDGRAVVPKVKKGMLPTRPNPPYSN
jgi:hypothetical protein